MAVPVLVFLMNMVAILSDCQVGNEPIVKKMALQITFVAKTAKNAWIRRKKGRNQVNSGRNEVKIKSSLPRAAVKMLKMG